MMNTIRVRARGTAKLPVPGMRGRFVGRDKAGEIIAEGVDVPEDGYHVRAINRGDIELAPAVAEPKINKKSAKAGEVSE